MKHAIPLTFLVAVAALFSLVACGAPDLVSATSVPTTASAPTATIPSGVATAPRSLSGTPTVRATAPSTPSTPAATPTGDRPGTPRSTTTPTRTAQGPRYALILGEAVTIPNSDLTIRFKAVTNDSRCPDSQFIACAWAGEATVSFEATVGAESHTMLLTMPGLTKDTTERGDNPKTHTTYKGYVIQIVSLEPQPTYTPPTTGLGTATISTPTPSGPRETTATILITAAP